MNLTSRMNKAFAKAPVLPLNLHSKYILISDCHRGCGTSNDNFLKNQNLYFAALQHYYREGYTYIELGDGDELWENRSMKQIIEIHSNVFWLLSEFYKENRLYLLFGNHDIIKRSRPYTKKQCSAYFCPEKRDQIPLLPGIAFYEGLILESEKPCHNIYLTHGHQADLLNSTFWRLSRFLVRYLWKPAERIGFLDPTSAAKNNTKKDSIERRLLHWAQEQGHILIAGHTHRPMLDDRGDTPYLNTGSCVHPRCITAIELEHYCLTLVKWTYCTRADMSVAVCREVLAGPANIEKFMQS